MSRLNPKRRLALRLANQTQMVHKARVEHDDSKLLQRGSPKTTSGRKFETNGAYATIRPRERSLEGRGPAWYKDGTRNIYQGDK